MMTDAEIAELCRDIDDMARRVSARFVPDHDKIAAIKKARVEWEQRTREVRHADGI